MKKIIILSLMILACMTASSFAAEMSGSDLWSGFYVGGNIGYGWAIDDATGYISSPSPAPFAFLGLPAAYKSSTNPAGLIGGAQVGYDWQPWPRWLLGAVADFQSSGQRDTDNFNIPFTITAIGVPVGTGNLAISNEEKLRWFGTVRGKIGYAFWNSVLLYGTGGFAYGRVDLNVRLVHRDFLRSNRDHPASIQRIKNQIWLGSRWRLARNNTQRSSLELEFGISLHRSRLDRLRVQ